jgi:hypothetical protein
MLTYPEPTAEQVVQAVEATFLLGKNATLENVADFMSLDINIPHQRQQVENSLLAARMLNLALPKPRSIGYNFSPMVSWLVKARDEDKRVLFRAHLEMLEPFRLLIDRLRADIPAREAARQVCAVRDFADDPVVAWRAFESWGTYSRSLIRAENGQYVPASSEEMLDILSQSLDNVAGQEQNARQHLLDQLGQEAFTFIEGNVRDSLINAVVMLTNGNPIEQVVLNCGIVFEDFLRLIGYRRVNLQRAHGIIQIGNQLRGNQLITQKHLGAIQLIGQIRNASDHGGDPDEGNRQWHITNMTTHLMLYAILSSIRSIVSYRVSNILEL